MMRTRADRGFSMIELMFVVTVLAVLVAVAMPRLSGSRDRAALETTAHQMARLAAYARQVAVTRQGEAVLVLRRDRGEWFLEAPLKPGERTRDRRQTARVKAMERDRRDDGRTPLESEEATRRLENKVMFGKVLIADEEARAGDVEIIFYPNGAATGTVIELTNEKGRRMTVEIEAATGRASAYFGDPKTFGEKLAELGVDPEAYGEEGPRASDTDGGPIPGEGFRRIGQSEEGRVKAYQDAAARIMSRATSKYTRKQAGQEAREGGEEGFEAHDVEGTAVIPGDSGGVIRQ